MSAIRVRVCVRKTLPIFLFILVAIFSTAQPTVAGDTPVAKIVSVTPNPVYQGNIVTFLGEGSDSAGTITQYEWVLDGSTMWNTARVDYRTTYLSIGYHTLTFRVADNELFWSDEQTTTLRVVELSTGTTSDTSMTPFSDETFALCFIIGFFAVFFGIFGLMMFFLFRNKQNYTSPSYSYNQSSNNSAAPAYYNRYSTQNRSYYVNPYYRYAQANESPPPSAIRTTIAGASPDLSTPKGRAEKALADAQSIIFAGEFRPQAIELFNKAQYAYADEKFDDAEKYAKQAVDSLSSATEMSGPSAGMK